MCHTSPAKQLRSVKRMAKFLVNKNTVATPKKPLLTAVLLPQTDIQPDSSKMLEVKRNPRISIFPKPKNISFRKFLPFEIVPGTQDTDRLFFSSYIDGCTLHLRQHLFATFVMMTTATILPRRCAHIFTRITITS